MLRAVEFFGDKPCDQVDRHNHSVAASFHILVTQNTHTCYNAAVPRDLLMKQGLTYLLTPWSRVLLEKLTGSAASQEIPRIFGTRNFITVLTSARHLSLS